MYKTEAQIVSYGKSKVTANDLACLEAINRLKWPPPVPLFVSIRRCLNSIILLV